MPERYKRVPVGVHCAKVKGYAELKIEKPRVRFAQITPFQSNPSSFRGNVHLRQNLFLMVQVIERSRDITPRSMTLIVFLNLGISGRYIKFNNQFCHFGLS